jgi:DNA-directed RNA polymerase specialized sigma24 family protein
MSHVLSGLDAEWSRVACSPAARRSLAGWSAVHPPLRELTDLNDLLERRRDPDKAPAILAALAALAEGDELAALTLLKALVPGLVQLAVTAGYDDPGALDEMLSLAWVRIRSYPTGRPGTVAGNVILDVKKQYRCHRRIDAPRRTALPSSPVLPPGDAELARSAEDVAMDGVAFDEFMTVQRRILSDRGLRAVIRTRVVGLSLAEAANAENVSVHTLTMRRQRAEQSLARQQVSRLQRAG